MAGWMEREGQIDGWMDRERWMDEWIDRQIDRQIGK